jgi:hypothetical protein
MIGFAVLTETGRVLAHCRRPEDAEAIFQANKNDPAPIFRAHSVVRWQLPEEAWDENFTQIDGSSRTDVGGICP